MQGTKDFNRESYYCLSELTRMYRGKLSLYKIKALITAHNLPLVERPIEIGYDRGDNYNVTAKYVLKTDWHRAVD